MAALKKRLKGLHEWADETEADFTKVMVELKTSKKEVELYVQLLNAAETTADANDVHIARLNTEVGELKELLKTEQDKREAAEKEVGFSAVMFEYAENKADAEICALEALLNAERLKHKTLVDSLSNMRVVLDEPFDMMPTATCVRCKNPVSTHAGTVCA